MNGNQWIPVFGPAKVAMKKIVTQFYVTTRFSKITKAHFTHLMSLLVKLAFAISGIPSI